MQNAKETWIVAYTDNGLSHQGHKTSSFKEASKFATLMIRNGYDVLAVFQEKAKDAVDWDIWYEKNLSGLDTQ